MIDEIVDALPKTHRWATVFEVEQALVGNTEYTNRMVQVRPGEEYQTNLAIYMVKGEDDHGNLVARENIDRCHCGCKYWENDHCCDCDSHVSAAVSV